MFKKAAADFREASEWRYDTSSEAYRFCKNLPDRSLVHKRLSIYNWNPGPRRVKEDAFEKQIAGRWHVITLQEAVEYVNHDILTNRYGLFAASLCSNAHGNQWHTGCNQQHLQCHAEALSRSCGTSHAVQD